MARRWLLIPPEMSSQLTLLDIAYSQCDMSVNAEGLSSPISNHAINFTVICLTLQVRENY